MGKASKVKGSSAERELCKLLSENLGGSFIRTANSGAFLGAGNAYRKASLSETQILGQKGDIIPPDDMKRLVVESKSYADFEHHLMLTDSCSKMDAWIEQIFDAKDDGDFWLICFKTNRKPWNVVFDASLASKFTLGSYGIYQSAKWPKVTIVNLKNWLENNKETISEFAEKGI